MRTENEVQDRIRFLLSKELDHQIATLCSRVPQNCQYNHRQPLDIRKEIEGEPNTSYNRIAESDAVAIGLCMLGASDPLQWNGTICEDPIDAQRCQQFELVSTKEILIANFNNQIKDFDWVIQFLPEVYGLLWALGSEAMPKLPWWKRFWFRLMRIRPDPLSNKRA